MVSTPNRMISTTDGMVSTTDRMISTTNRMVSTTDGMVSTRNRMVSTTDRMISTTDGMVSTTNRMVSTTNRMVSTTNRMISTTTSIATSMVPGNTIAFQRLVNIIYIDYDRNDSYRYDQDDTLWDRYIYIRGLMKVKVTCNPNCLNGGTCVAMNTCQCVTNVWIGPYCQTPMRILWAFDNNLDDLYNNFQGVGSNGPTYRSPGITGYGTCLYLNATSSQSVTIFTPPFLNMALTSFSLFAWVKATSFHNTANGSYSDNAIFGQLNAKTSMIFTRPTTISKRQISEAASTEQNLDQLPPSYMYSVIFKDIILEIDHDDNKSMNALVNFCREQNIPEIQINLLQGNYHEKSPIWWYTKPMFLYGMLNRALRILDMKVMIKFGFFIQSLHLQLEQLHQAQSANFQEAFTVYRGQELSQKDFQNLLDSKGGLLSFNNFLSTSKKPFAYVVSISESM
ncbi:unnamed protein product [Rotaria socialis]